MELKFKELVLESVLEAQTNFKGSQREFAVSLNVNPAQLSTFMSGKLSATIGDKKLLAIARKLKVGKPGVSKWKAVETPVYQAVTAILGKCQEDCVSAIICDEADIGKTFAAEMYCRMTKGALYIDCSQVKNRQQLIRQIARELGVSNGGSYKEVYDAVVYNITTADLSHLVVLDEVGDLNYEAFLELKALWNATEECCGWTMMGADALRHKIERGIRVHRVGFSEIFSRFGSRFQRITPDDAAGVKEFRKEQGAMIIEANFNGNFDVNKVLVKTDGSLRRIKIERSKVNATN